MKRMLRTMRWYGPNDTTTLADLKQAGVEGIVTSLHHIPVGETWEIPQIEARIKEIEQLDLKWSVVESLPVHEDIKRKDGNFRQYVENYKKSIVNLAKCGIHVITYNFMPVLDWVRTHHNFKNSDGSEALYFNKNAFVYFDIELLKRPDAREEYSDREISEALNYGKNLTDGERKTLFRQALLGLPGSDKDFTADEVLQLLQLYKGLDHHSLRENLIYFLQEVIPTAETVGTVLAIHPDDPPFPILGLPRILSTQDDFRLLTEAVPSISNGLCYCTGSFGARADNDLLSILDKFKDRIHFLHLRNVVKDNMGNFRESHHLQGDNPISEIVGKIVDIIHERDVSIPMRPDHGFLHSLEKEKKHYAGYSLIGRLKGLAEITGLEQGIMYRNGLND